MSKANWRRVGLVSLLAVGLLVVIGITQEEVKNPDTLIVATIGDLETLDPAWHYDTASATAIFNIYETLVFYEREKVVYKPQLATEWEVSEDGLTYTFTLREGVKFHEGGDLTCEDVAYSFQRTLLQDRSGGPVWMLLEPILGVSAIEDLATEVGDDEACAAVKAAAECVDGKFVLHLAEPFGPILDILAGSWGAILDKEWMIEQGDWDGDCATWREFHDPTAEASTIFNRANGTGPFKLERWLPGEEISFLRNDNYWNWLPKLERAVIKVVDEWGTRLAMFEAQDADTIYVPRAYLDQAEPLLSEECIIIENPDLPQPLKNVPVCEERKREKPIARVYKDLPGVSSADTFFSFNVDVTGGNPYIFSGALDGEGVPPDFFSDIDVRKGFNYCFDWETFIKDLWMGEAVQRTGPINAGVFAFNPDQPTYSYDPEKAAEHFKKAWGGKAWDVGFKVNILYNTGNLMRKAAMEMLEACIEGLNPKFQVEVLDLPWPTYLKEMVAGRLPLYMIGWHEDYHHPHNWVHPYMHRAGAFASAQAFDYIKNVEFTPVYATFLEAKTYPTLQDLFDELIKIARVETDIEKARLVYYELQNLAYIWAIDIFMVTATGRRYEQEWVQGWYYNPTFPGNYFYPQWKAIPEKVELGPYECKAIFGPVAPPRYIWIWLKNLKGSEEAPVDPEGPVILMIDWDPACLEKGFRPAYQLEPGWIFSLSNSDSCKAYAVVVVAKERGATVIYDINAPYAP